MLSKILISTVLITLNLLMDIEGKYTLLPAFKCREMLKEQGISLNKYCTTLHISSRKGVVFELNEGRVLLLPLTGDSTYPGIVFSDSSTFEHFSNLDSFPIGEEYMTWHEKHMGAMKNWLTEKEFYFSIVENKLDVKLPLSSISDCQELFEKSYELMKSESVTKKVKLEVLECVALTIAEYLVSKKGYSWCLEKRYEIYNPYFLLTLEKDGHKYNVLEHLAISLGSNEPSFSLFSTFVGLNGTPGLRAK
jgi:hypothetical protein